MVHPGVSFGGCFLELCHVVALLTSHPGFISLCRRLFILLLPSQRLHFNNSNGLFSVFILFGRQLCSPLYHHLAVFPLFALSAAFDVVDHSLFNSSFSRHHVSLVSSYFFDNSFASFSSSTWPLNVGVSRLIGLLFVTLVPSIGDPIYAYASFITCISKTPIFVSKVFSTNIWLSYRYLIFKMLKTESFRSFTILNPRLFPIILLYVWNIHPSRKLHSAYILFNG